MTVSGSLEIAWRHVATASLQGSALIVAVVIAQRVLKRRMGPAWSFALWFLVLARLSLPVLPTSSWSWERASDALLARASAFAGKSEPASEATIPAVVIPGEAGAVSANTFPPPSAPVAASIGAMEILGSTYGVPEAGPAPWRPAAAWLGWLWMLGVLGLLAWQALSTWHFRRRIRQWPMLTDPRLWDLVDECRHEMGIRRGLEIRVARSVDNPCLYGVFRPVLLLPATLEDRLAQSEWRDVMLHELGHVRRLDPLWNSWMSILNAVHWFNPLVWWAAARMREDRELACDSLVLARKDSQGRRSYGETLLKLASFPAAPAGQPGATVGILENGGPLKSRLQALGFRPNLWLNGALGLAVLFFFGACALTRQPEPVSSSEIQPVRLMGFTDFPQAAVAPGTLQRYQDNPATWAQIPKGDQVFFGVPFEITGLIRLAGTGGERFNEWYFRPKVEGIPIARPFARLYLLHSTSYFSDIGRTIALVRLNYSDGTSADLPIRYGYQVLNDWRQRYESTSLLRDSDSRVAWTGETASLAEYGNSFRFCLSSLKNPYPKKTVRTVDLISTRSESAEVIAGMAVGDRHLPAEWRSSPAAAERDSVWKSRLRFRAL
ncbi:MAG: hypothetical protein KIT22_05895, partial [Verrucomicrobiae bacterium]|nr:hypothetical protein [Verrucomicrobiae bacterium]